MRLIISLILAINLFWTDVHAGDVLIVLNKAEATAWLIDPTNGKTLKKLPVGDGPHEAAVSPDGRTAVACNYGSRRGGETLTVIDIPSRSVTKTIDLSPYSRPHGIQSFPDGKHILVTSETGQKLLKISIETGKIVSAFDTGGGSHMVALDLKNNTAYATAMNEGILSKIDLMHSNGSLKTVQTGRGTEALALHPTKPEIWVGNNREHRVKIVNAHSLEIVAEIECGLQPIRIAFSNDGKHALVSCLLSGNLAVIDAEKRAFSRRVNLSDVVLKESEWKGKSAEEVRPLIERVVREGARPIGVLVGPDGHFAYVANRGLNHIAVVDLRSWKVVRRLPTGDGPDGMAWSRIVD